MLLAISTDTAGQPHRSALIRAPFALISTIVAICVISQFGASPAAGQTPSTPARLQPLVNDAVAQLKISYRHDRAEREKRYETIGQAIDAWNKSHREATDNERLAEWLRAAMRASMPGSHTPLPTLPEFGTAATRTEAISVTTTDATKPAAGVPDTATAPQASDVDESSSAESPFHDDIEPSPPAKAVETNKPVATDEGDPFQDDPPQND